MGYHLRTKIFILFFLTTWVLDVGILAADKTVTVIQVEDFSRFKDGTFPDSWKARGGDPSKVYSIKTKTESYLDAKAINTAVSIAKEFEYDLENYPFLSWQWRVLELPRGGDERYKKTGDSAAAIYVIFPGLIRPDNIKYVWSTSLPISTTTESPYNSKTKIVVLRNQSSPIGIWVSEKVNVYEDYKRLFGSESKQVKAIGLMSDSDNTESIANAHYKAISISKD
jgi:hypothetical protein